VEPQALEASFPAQVFVRIDSTTQYQKCRIVDVQPALDLAVLKMETEDRPAAPNSNTTDISDWTVRSNQSTTVKVLPSLTFGSSLDLLVGQSLVAIGNPFGLDTTVTTGVVSALQIDLKVASRSRQFGVPPVTTTPTIIRNGIQTDCAINPGNSGGPLLNLNGHVVGVTTAIVTTSGSNAGIGFAIPSLAVAPTVAAMIRRDVAQSAPERKRRGWLGVSIWKRQPADGRDQPNWVAAVSPNSPAARAGIQTLQIGTASLDDDPNNAIVVHYGNAIVTVGGEATISYTALQTILDRCVVGEHLALTLFNGVTRQRRVVYVTLETRP
jgi:S1-C subfamily serine protease